MHPTTATTSSSRRLHSHEREGPSGRIRASASSGTRARPSAGASSVDDASRYSSRRRRAARRAASGADGVEGEGRRTSRGPRSDARGSSRGAEEAAGSRSRSGSREAAREERMGRRAAATFAASEVDDDAEAREVDALARRSHLGSSVTGCRRGSEGLGERKARTARRGVAVRRVVTTTHQHGTPVRGGWVGVVAVLAVRLDVAVAEDPHRPSRHLEPRRLERLRQTLGGASPRLRGGERALRARDAGARPRHRRERREHQGATRERAHDDGSDARAPPSFARPHAASVRHHHDERACRRSYSSGARTVFVRRRTLLFPRSFSLAHDDRLSQAVRSLTIL